MFTFEEGVGQITLTVNQSTEADPDLAFTLSAATDSITATGNTLCFHFNLVRNLSRNILLH